MPRELSIEEADDCGLDEDHWLTFVDNHALLRRAVCGPSFRNPATGDVISMGFDPRDAELLVGNTWTYAFRWSNGRIKFNERPYFDSATPARHVAHEMAQALHALQSHSAKCQRFTSIDNVLQKRMAYDDSSVSTQQCHRAAVALPLAVAHL